jgi:hypothetical protein
MSSSSRIVVDKRSVARGEKNDVMTPGMHFRREPLNAQEGALPF